MTMGKESAWAACFAVAVATALAGPTSPRTWFDCNADQLPREAAGGRRLAASVDGDWRFFLPNYGAAAHILDTGGQPVLCLAWEAPPYPGDDRQIVYANTRYRDDQPLWLFRNGVGAAPRFASAGAAIPFVGTMFGNWSGRTTHQAPIPTSASGSFTAVAPSEPAVEPRNELGDWHDASGWLADRRSYDLVKATTGLVPLPRGGTHRLLVLAPARPLTSWIRFETRAPSERDELRVAISYSSDLEKLGPRVHQYVFRVR